jgi:osmoprotectant transport system permease protein
MRRDRRRILIGVVALAVGTLAAVAPFAHAGRHAYVIGAKNFSEQFILSDVIGDQLGKAGAEASHKDGLGSAIVFRALASSDIDVYVDYTGTLWTNVLHRTDAPPRAQMLAELTRQLKARYGVVVLGPLGFENAYALTMTSARAQALGVRSIQDLVPKAGQLTLGGDLEFLSRPEWAAIRTAYGLSFKAQRSYNPTFMYSALEDGEADVISAFSSDGRIAADHLVVLTDPKGAIPNYDAVLLISPKRAGDQRLRQALAPLIGRIDVAHMRQANLMVDRAKDKRSPEDAARWLEAAVGLK